MEDIFIDRPPVLNDLLGKNSLQPVEKNGVLLEVIRREDGKNNRILSELTKETGIVFSIVWGGLDNYRDKLLGSFIINVEKEDEDKVVKYFESKNVEWRYTHE